MKWLPAAILPLYSILAAYPAYAATAKPGARAPQEAVVLGLIDFGNEGSKNVVTAPTTVAVGEEFKLTITTFGGGCEREGTAARSSPRQARLSWCMTSRRPSIPG